MRFTTCMVKRLSPFATLLL